MAILRGAAIPFAGVCVLVSTATAGRSLAACNLNLITHGTVVVRSETSPCVEFRDDVGQVYEILNPGGGFPLGKTGTIYGEITSGGGSCDEGLPVFVCVWQPDYHVRTTGRVIIKNFIECPGFYIHVDGGDLDYFVSNCEDVPGLCEKAMVGERVQVELFVDTGVSVCLGAFVSDVLSWSPAPS
jgi:hypothetical protein